MFTENENPTILEGTEPETTPTPAVVQEEDDTVDQTIVPDSNTPTETIFRSAVVVDCVKLNVRKEPRVNAPIICTIPRGTEVVAFEKEPTDEFYRICTASSIEGYCMKKYINVDR